MAFIINPGDIYIPESQKVKESTYAHGNFGQLDPAKGEAQFHFNDDRHVFGTYHMADRPDLFEPMRTNNFEFQVEGLGRALLYAQNKLASDDKNYLKQYRVENLLKGIIASTDTPGPGDAELVDELLRMSVEQGFQPHFTQNPIPVKRGNSTLNYAGVPSWGTGQIRVKDFIGLQAKNALMAWQNLSYNVKTERVGLASSYKLDCYISEYTPDYIRVHKWKLYGCWITGLSEGGLDSTNGDSSNQITATICYDRAEPDDID